MSTELVSARAVAPGRVLKRELEARGWTQKDLAAILGRPEQAVSEIVTGRKQVTPETALELAKALGTSAELWLNLETRYRLALGRRTPQDDSISRRSAVYSRLPVRELVRRGWISETDDVDQLERETDALLRWGSAEELALAARRTRSREPDEMALLAWMCRVRQQASEQRPASFEADRFATRIQALLELTSAPKGVAAVPKLLLRSGVRLVVVSHLSGTHLDGALLRDPGETPIIALTLRYDRLDNFWFTLMHEVAHLALGHSGTRVDDLEAAPAGKDEAEADHHAQELLLPKEVLSSFVGRCGGYISRAKLERFALEHERAPGIVVGRLHHEKLLPYTHLRGLLVKVSPFLATGSRELPEGIRGLPPLDLEQAPADILREERDAR